MGKGNVVALPVPTKAFENQIREESQLDLFEMTGEPYPRIAVIDPDLYDEDSLLRTVGRFNITLILDMRLRPIFEKPKYSHKRITSYFYNRNIRYIDIAHLIYSANDDMGLIEKKLISELRVPEAGGVFFGLCLVDRRAREDGVVALFRSELRRQTGRVVEVHPRSIGL